MKTLVVLLGIIGCATIAAGQSFQYMDIGDITKRLNDLSHKAQEQNDFYKNYLSLTGEK